MRLLKSVIFQYLGALLATGRTSRSSDHFRLVSKRTTFFADSSLSLPSKIFE